MSDILHIYLLRHARQISPLCNVDVSIADEGLLQSKLVAKRLKKYNIDKVYSSNLIRAKMTADIIRNEIGIKDCGNCEIDDLRETDFGYLTGLSDEVIKKQYCDYFNTRENSLEDISIPGGENGIQVYQRMNDAISSIIDNGIRNNYKNIVIVSHGGAIRCYLAGLLGMPFGKRFAIAKNMENCSITQIDYHINNRNYSVEKINDYSHLEKYENLLRKNFK